VWRHGFLGRVTQDVDIVLPAAKVDKFLRVASVSGFHALSVPPECWPKVVHGETGIDVDILPEGGRPGTSSNPAPTTIPHPSRIGASGTMLRYIELAPLIELKIATGRAQDQADVVQLILANRDRLESVRGHLASAHPEYVKRFDRLVEQADDEGTHSL
jgi:hypothetical protein